MYLSKSPLKDGPAESEGDRRRLLPLTGGWRAVPLASVLAALLAIAGLRLIEPQYTAVLVVAPTARTGAAAIGTRIPDRPGEGLAAVAEPGAADEVLSDFARFLVLLRSVPVADRLMADRGMAPRLFPDRWDAGRQAWVAPRGGWAWLKRAVLALAGRTTWTTPDAVTVAETLTRRVSIARNGDGPVRRITFRDVDREFALDLLSRVAGAAEAHLREEAARRARVQQTLVRQLLARQGISEENKMALTRLLQEVERLSMVLTADLPYAVDVIEPVHADRLPDWPDALLVVAAFALAALLGTVCLIGCRRYGWRPGEPPPCP